MNLVETTGPVNEPVSLNEALDHLRIDHSADNGLVGAQIEAAVEWAETFTRRPFVERTYDLFFDNWPRFPLDLPRPPLQSVTGVYYTDEDGTETEYASSNYLVDTSGTPGRIVLKSTATLPTVTLLEANAIRIRFVAGYGAASDVPSSVKAAILLLVGDLYENRENTIVGAGNSIVQVPFSVTNLLWPYRVEW